MKTRVFHADIYGTRKGKREFLNTHSITDKDWDRLNPAKPYYMFKPVDMKLDEEYRIAPKISDAFTVSNVGIVTARDKLTIQFEQSQIWETVRHFAKLDSEEARTKYNLGKDVRDWKVHLAQKDLNQTGPSKKHITPILYRPFDIRQTYYTGKTKGFHCMPRGKFMRHMLEGENLGLISRRQMLPKNVDYFYVTDKIISDGVIRSDNKGCESLFPLYLYPDPEKAFEDSPWPGGKDGRRPNLSKEFVDECAGKLGLEFVTDGRGDLEKTFGPEDIFNYAYAVFHSPTYRGRYAEFLKIDFPRLPLTSDKSLFAELCRLGGELVGLHLLENVSEPRATYPQEGTNLVQRIGKKAYKPPTDQAPGCVYVNDSQYFQNVPEDVWMFHVGGYQVCQKWLKDRKGRTLSFDDIETYRKITEAIRRTIRLMAEIDETIGDWPIE